RKFSFGSTPFTHLMGGCRKFSFLFYIYVYWRFKRHLTTGKIFLLRHTKLLLRRLILLPVRLMFRKRHTRLLLRRLILLTVRPMFRKRHTRLLLRRLILLTVRPILLTVSLMSLK